MKKVTDNIFYVGVNDHEIDLFEGMYDVPNGMAYNSYIVVDDEITIFDTVDQNFTNEWLDNVQEVLGGKKPNYLVVQHMEPDHSANIDKLLKLYPDLTVIGNAKTFAMMENFFGKDIAPNRKIVNDGERLTTGKHTFVFVFAPMVHWPEVMLTYDEYDKVLFSADAFGKFGALDVEEAWACEARRYYFGIVGKYGVQVQNVLKKAKALDIKIICPLHGPILSENLEYHINLYDIWSNYGVESEGIMIAYTSVYGHTAKAVNELAELLKENGCPKVVVADLAREDMAECVEDAFRYGKLVLATTTYNSDIFPFMKDFLNHLIERGYKNRTIAMIENGSWAPTANKVMKSMLEGLKNITYTENNVTIKSALDSESTAKLQALANELCAEYKNNEEKVQAPKKDLTALFNIGYGLYVVTSNDGKKDNGMIVNTVTQLTSKPNRVAVTINKDNYSHHVIKQTGILNVNCLSVDAPFGIFEQFGFKSGRNVDKFENETPTHSVNGLVVLSKYINSYMSLKVVDYVDLGSHGMFICKITEAEVFNKTETMTYTYYQNNVKPKPQTEGKKGFVCKVCGYVYEGETLPEDYVCPLCKHGAIDFEEIK